MYEILGKRNPILRFSHEGQTYLIQTIGDPHLGRNCRNNSKHRLGDREDSIKQTFYRKLRSHVGMTVIMGDLFDKVTVTNEWLDFAIKAIEDAANEFPDRLFIILNGNHDLTKDKSRISSFNLLQKYFNSLNLRNLFIVSDTTSNMYIEKLNLTLCFTHYDPFEKLDGNVTVDQLYTVKDSFKVAFGHFETESFGSDKFINREVPDTLLSEFDLIVSGHIHKPYLLKIKGVDIVVTGSMQPYAFGEEISEDGSLYVTLSLDELTTILEKDPNTFSNSNVRVLYKSNQDLPDPFDCYSTTYKLITEDNQVETITFDTDTLSFQQMFLQALESNLLPNNSEYISEIKRVFMEKDYDSNN